ncbi:hypothetical protein PG991_015506 [Apiospora marii]|uniref:Uncharacterized protein n=1 Tax=Apiospora marii TaxID=335849 RepID=A0ABR1R1T2_9PEZI
MRAITTFLAVLGLASKAWAAQMPANSTTEDASIDKRFVGGWCGVHVQVRVDHEKATESAWVRVFDGAQTISGTTVFEDTKGVNGFGGILHHRLECPLQISVFRPGSLVAFAYNGDVWYSHANTKDDRCSVGDWDNTDVGVYSTIDMDCGFSC